MDYTQSNSFVTDPGTGHRMHDATQATPTEVSDKDMNSVLWSLMELLNAANLAGQQFDPADPVTYRLVRDAVNVMIARGSGCVAVAAGTADAITANFSPDVAQLTNGLRLRVRAGAVNTSATPTFQANATPAKPIVRPGGLPLAPGDIGAGRWLDLVYDSTLDKYVLLNPAGPRELKQISASVAANALTVTLQPCTMEFRSGVLTNGSLNVRTLAAAASLVVPSGATLGTVAAQGARLVVLALDGPAGVEPAIVNVAGGVNLDESGTISTTAITAAANSAGVVYSAAARAGVPYRVAGYVDITEAVAGTWATAPASVVGSGAIATTAMASLGYGQTWQSVLGSRAGSTTYYNTTGRPICLAIGVNVVPAAGPFLTINGVQAGSYSNPAGSNLFVTFVGIVPPGGSYSLSLAGSILSVWNELR